MIAISVGFNKYICSYDGWNYPGIFFKLNILEALGWEEIDKL